MSGNPEYLERHPDAVKDVDKARDMAYKENLIEIDGVEINQQEARKICYSSDATWTQLQAILKSGSEDTVRDAARNPNIPPEELEKLANNPSALVVASVAGNKSTPPGVLTALANKELPGNNLFIHEAVAANSSTPQETLQNMFEQTKNWDVIESLAGNPSTPESVLLDLLDGSFSEDREFYPELEPDEKGSRVIDKYQHLERVNRRLARRDKLSEELARGLIERGYGQEVADNPGTPREILEELTHADFWVTRENAYYSLYPEEDPANS